MDPLIRTSRDGEVAEIVLDRPAKLNAMNVDWIRQFHDAVLSLEGDPDLRVVIIRGEGRAFCAGLDQDMMAAEGMPPEFFPGQEAAFTALERLPAVVVALIHGYCLGGGLQLAVSCDIRIASEDALLGAPAALEGLPPGVAPWRLPRFIGIGRAMRLCLTGEHLAGADAERIGLVDHLLPTDGFLEAGRALAHEYTRTPHGAAVAIKHMVRGSFDTDFGSAFAYSQDTITELLDGDDVAAGRRAWAERRAGRTT